MDGMLELLLVSSVNGLNVEPSDFKGRLLAEFYVTGSVE